MAKLYFRYGTMDSSKTARLLMDAYEYTQRGQNVLLLKPVLDTRSATGKIVSRVGLEADSVDISEVEDLFALVRGLDEKPSCIFVDEAQFLKELQVVQLRLVVNSFNIPVMCYGLKTDFMGNLFEGSQALFQHANRFEEIKTICRHEGCSNKAMYNVRFLDGKPVFEGEQVKVGDTKQEEGYYYIPKCSVHFFSDFATARKENSKI